MTDREKLPVIYIAGPYTAETTSERDANVWAAMVIAQEFAKDGWAIICPHTQTYRWEESTDMVYEQFMDIALELLSRCDAICMAPGWKESEGAKREHKLAKELGLPVYYFERGVWKGDVSNVPQAFGPLGDEGEAGGAERERYWESIDEKVRHCGLKHERVSVALCNKCKGDEETCEWEQDVHHDDWQIEEVHTTDSPAEVRLWHKRFRDALIFKLIRQELTEARKEFPKYNSPHEGYAVILEELDELWDAVKADAPRQWMVEEAIQVAATAIRFISHFYEKEGEEEL